MLYYCVLMMMLLLLLAASNMLIPARNMIMLHDVHGAFTYHGNDG